MSLRSDNNDVNFVDIPVYDGKNGVIINQPPPSPEFEEPCEQALDTLVRTTLGELLESSFFENGSLLDTETLPDFPSYMLNMTLLPSGATPQLNSSIQGSLVATVLNCSANCTLTWQHVLVAALGPDCEDTPREAVGGSSSSSSSSGGGDDSSDNDSSDSSDGGSDLDSGEFEPPAPSVGGDCVLGNQGAGVIDSEGRCAQLPEDAPPASGDACTPACLAQPLCGLGTDPALALMSPPPSIPPLPPHAVTPCTHATAACGHTTLFLTLRMHVPPCRLPRLLCGGVGRPVCGRARAHGLQARAVPVHV